MVMAAVNAPKRPGVYFFAASLVGDGRIDEAVGATPYPDFGRFVPDIQLDARPYRTELRCSRSPRHWCLPFGPGTRRLRTSALAAVKMSIEDAIRAQIGAIAVNHYQHNRAGLAKKQV